MWVVSGSNRPSQYVGKHLVNALDIGVVAELTAPSDQSVRDALDRRFDEAHRGGDRCMALVQQRLHFRHLQSAVRNVPRPASPDAGDGLAWTPAAMPATPPATTRILPMPPGQLTGTIRSTSRPPRPVPRCPRRLPSSLRIAAGSGLT